jgi:hypothetical protein
MVEWRHSSTILDLGTRWRRDVSFRPWLLTPWGKSPQYPMDRRLGGPQELIWMLWIKKKISCPCWESNPSRPVRSPSLYQLSYHGSSLYIIFMFILYYIYTHNCFPADHSQNSGRSWMVSHHTQIRLPNLHNPGC